MNTSAWTWERVRRDLYEAKDAVFGILALMLVLGVDSAYASIDSGFYTGKVQDMIDKSSTIVKMVRFIAVFIVIGGLIWAGVEFAIKNDQQKGSMVLISAVIGAFFVLVAPTIMTFIIGGVLKDGEDVSKVAGS